MKTTGPAKNRTDSDTIDFLSARIASASVSKDLNYPCALSQNLDKFQFLSNIKLIGLSTLSKSVKSYIRILWSSDF